MGQPLPPMVYMPAQEIRPGDDEFQVELRHTEQGAPALLVYSALDRLVDACGDAQPWALIRATDIDDLRHRLGYDLILLDAPLPDGRAAVARVTPWVSEPVSC